MKSDKIKPPEGIKKQEKTVIIMNSFEKKILIFIEKNLWCFVLAFSLLAGTFLRITLRGFISEDMYNYLLVWYDQIKSLGGISALSEQVGNYNVLYQFILAVFTYLPIPPVFAIKILSCIFDLALAVITGLYLFDYSNQKDYLKGTLGFSLIWLSPIVALNSSMWGQCDSIYVFFVLFSLISLEKEHFTRAFLLLGVAFSFKLQAMFILPYFAYVYLSKKKFSIFNFLWVPFVMWLTTLPAIIAGRGLLTGFKLYFSQAGEYRCLTMNEPNAISLITYNFQQTHYEYMAPLFIVLTLLIIGSILIYMLYSKIELSKEAGFLFALVLAYTAVFFLPAMHERYGYIYEILAIIYCFKNKKSIIPCALMMLVSLCTYGVYLMGGSVTLKSLVFLNMFVYLWYMYLFFKEVSGLKKGEKA